MVSYTTSEFTKTDTLALLTFTVGQQTYGLPVANVARIIEMVTIIRLPGAPDNIEGVINVQGKSVPIMDLRQRFGLPQQTYGLHTPIVLANTGSNKMLGLIVDTVNDVVHVSHKNLETTKTIVPAGLEQQIADQAAYLAGVANIDQHMIVVLNGRSLLTLAEQTTVFKAIEQIEQPSSQSESDRQN